MHAGGRRDPAANIARLYMPPPAVLASLFAAFVVVLAIVVMATPVLYDYVRGRLDAKKAAPVGFWQGELAAAHPGFLGLALRDVVIPGTHDTATGVAGERFRWSGTRVGVVPVTLLPWVKNWTQTQYGGVTRQLETGARLLDVRVRFVGDGAGGAPKPAHTQHGAIHVNYPMADLLAEVRDFLARPGAEGEFVVLFLSRFVGGNDASHAALIQQIRDTFPAGAPGAPALWEAGNPMRAAVADVLAAGRVVVYYDVPDTLPQPPFLHRGAVARWRDGAGGLAQSWEGLRDGYLAHYMGQPANRDELEVLSAHYQYDGEFVKNATYRRGNLLPYHNGIRVAGAGVAARAAEWLAAAVEANPAANLCGLMFDYMVGSDVIPAVARMNAARAAAAAP